MVTSTGLTTSSQRSARMSVAATATLPGTRRSAASRQSWIIIVIGTSGNVSPTDGQPSACGKNAWSTSAGTESTDSTSCCRSWVGAAVPIGSGGAGAVAMAGRRVATTVPGRADRSR